ncbi:MAG: hypothetical protein AVDCRST_MAG13-2134, partial [uncultured Solirubrobacteraceae bacterium]
GRRRARAPPSRRSRETSAWATCGTSSPRPPAPGTCSGSPRRRTSGRAWRSSRGRSSGRPRRASPYASPDGHQGKAPDM